MDSLSVTIPEDKYTTLHQRRDTLIVTPTLKEWIKQKTKSTCTKKMLHKRIPILGWLPQYNADSVVADLVAGTTVGLTVIPQVRELCSCSHTNPGCFITITTAEDLSCYLQF